jgi:hypothetical protein
LSVALLLAAALAIGAPTARAEEQPAGISLKDHAHRIKQTQVQMIREGAKRKIMGARAWAEAAKQAKKKHQPLPPRPTGRKRAPTDADDIAPPPAASSAPRLGAQAVMSIPANVRVNDPTGDDPAAGQAEQCIASLGQNVLVAWNDGQGFVTGGDTQGYGYSVDGGASFVDGGDIPAPDAGGFWTSDPIVTVNEATGDFYYCGLYDPDGTGAQSSVAIARGHFAGGAFVWDASVTVRTVDATQFFIDKEWMVADQVTGNLYLTYTLFSLTGDDIVFQRSTTSGASWDSPITLSAPAASGFVQGSRPVVGPDGEVYAIWSEIGLIDQDYFRLRKSTNQGVSWGSEVTPAGRFTNFGVGAPGFNRERSIDFPSIAVDRTTGPNRGRVYVNYHESLNWFDDTVGGGGNQNEIEPNSGTGNATLFTPGQILRGAFSSTSDQDWFRFTGTQGTSYIFWVDSIPRPLYTIRIFCTDGSTRLSYAGDLSPSPGGNSFIIFTAPATATYYMRMFYVAGGIGIGGYHIYTGIAAAGAELGRDQRDVGLTYSDDGTSWSTPVRVNDDLARFDDWLPEVSVGPDGHPYVMWFDWRDATANCNGSSHIYVSRSTDGGATWVPGQRATSALSPWTTSLSNIAPNQGDYNHMWSDARYVRPNWADGRNANVDVYTTAIDTWHSVSGCAPDTTMAPNGTRDLNVGVSNGSPLFANTYSYTITSDRGWSLASGSLGSVAAEGSASTPVTITVPDTADAGVTQVCVNVSNQTGTLVQSCCFDLTVTGSVGVEDGPLVFALGQNVPNPSRGRATRIDFSLPRSGSVRLEVFGLHGERVRTLVDGERAAGPNAVVWDGLDDQGHAVGAGTYFYRLSGLGQSLTRRMTVLP